jgi:p-hydroxybenzoate 3-monooxygenase
MALRRETTVAIIGAGPAGLMLGHLLAKHGIAAEIIENRSRAYCEGRVRAGLLEQGSVDLLAAIDCDARLRREGMVHGGTYLRFGGRAHRVDFFGLTGKYVTIYGQQEIVRDLIAARLERHGHLTFEVSDVAIDGFDGDRPVVRYNDPSGEPVELHCRYIAGCDGFHGVARATVEDRLRTFSHAYPFAWLGILAESKPLADELVYVHTEEGFALFTMRAPTVSRAYFQVPADEDVDAWTDAAIWAEFRRRLAGADDLPALQTGPILKKEVTPMRSFVAEPMRIGRLFLAGDAAHIVPPTGAKGLNLAFGDVALLGTAIAEAEAGDETLLDQYSELALARVWRSERLSHWMTSLMHVFPDASPFQHRMQLAELGYLAMSHAPAESFAEQYVGLPYAIGFDRITAWRTAAVR